MCYNDIITAQRIDGGSFSKQNSNRVMTDKYYDFRPNNHIATLLQRADQLNTQINELKNTDSSLWETILLKLKIDWTYNSNSIEGSTLSLGETHFFLTEGLTIEGKPFRDFLDAKNHMEAIEYLYDIIADDREISEGVIKELNALILSGVNYTKAQDSSGKPIRKRATPGTYKTEPNHVLLPSGEIHQYVEPIQVQSQMQELIEWIDDSSREIHPIVVASIVHYNLVRIHAFDDGNGRGARIVTNLILIKNHYFPVVIRSEKKRRYLEALQQADGGDISPFAEYVTTELIETLERVLVDL